MAERNQESAIAAALSILKNYSFEAGRLPYKGMLDHWLKNYPLSWISLAVVESLYQGRYKVISVEQILILWQRRGEPSFHFNHEFQRLVSNNLPHEFNFHWDYGSQPVKTKSFHRRRRPTFERIESAVFTSYQADPVPKISQPVDWNEPSLIEQPSLETKAENKDIESNQRPMPLDHLEPVKVDKDQDGGMTEAVELLEPLTDKDLTIGEQQQLALLQDVKIEPPSEVEVSAEGILSKEGEGVDESKQSLISVQSSVGIYHNPIVKFIPKTEPSGFYSKLTAIAQPNA